MLKKIILTPLLSTLLTSCITVSLGTATPAAPQFVTSTLPATQPATPRPTRTPASETAVTTNSAGGATKSTICGYSAVLIEDVTIPDYTKVAPGEKFTKIWKFKNIGTCHWKDLTIVFVSGDRMEAPDSAPVAETATGATVDVSVELVAPTMSGEHTANFSLKTSAGDTVQVGTGKTFWVKVVVGTGGTPVPTKSSSTSRGTPAVAIGNKNIYCKYSYSENPAYVQELASLINQARGNAGLPALSLNPRLTQAAQGHSIDMACNNFLGHEGSDGSNIGALVREVGYAGFTEIIAIGTPQNAMDQWVADAPHWDSVLDAGVTEMGIGYAYNANSDYGGYFTVDMN